MPVSRRAMSPSADEHQPKGLRFQQLGLPVAPSAYPVELCMEYTYVHI